MTLVSCTPTDPNTGVFQLLHFDNTRDELPLLSFYVEKLNSSTLMVTINTCAITFLVPVLTTFGGLYVQIEF